MRKVLCLAVVVFLGLTTQLPGAKKNGAEAVEKAISKPGLVELVQQLGDRRYPVRKKAQQAIAGMTDEVALPVLLKARLGTQDAEVARRLDLLIPAMERSALLKAKLVTLNIEKRTLRDIVAELSRQTGYGIDVMDNGSNATYSFKLDKVPFWVAMEKICNTAHVTINPNNNYWMGNDRIHLNSYGGASSPFVSHTQAFRLAASGFHYQRDITFAGGQGAKPHAHARSENLTLNLAIQSEPKLGILQVLNPEISEAYDENRKPMVIKTSGVNSASFYMNNGFRYSGYGNGYRFFSMTTQVGLLRPSRDSKLVKFVKGEIPVILCQEKPDIVIEQIMTVKKKKFRRSITEIEIDSVAEGNNPWGGNGKGYTINMTVHEQSDLPYNDYNWANTVQFRLDLVDAKGNKYMSMNSGFMCQGPRLAKGVLSFGTPQNAAFGPPVKLVYNQWMPINHRIKFEFADLPLP